jgi:hypothetical protein
MILLEQWWVSTLLVGVHVFDQWVSTLFSMGSKSRSSPFVIQYPAYLLQSLVMH